MRIWIITNARLRMKGALAASALQNMQTAAALATLGHRVLLWVAELEGEIGELMRERLGVTAPEGLRVAAVRPRGEQGEKKTALSGGGAGRSWRLWRARRALGGPPDAVITRSPRIVSQLRRYGLVPDATRVVLEYQYPEWAQLWRGWRRRHPEAGLAECRERLAHWQRYERAGVLAADGVLHAAQAHAALLARYGYGGAARWLPSGCQPPAALGQLFATTDAGRDYEFGYLGGLTPENGLETLLGALALLGRGRLLVAGWGEASYLADLKRRIGALGLERRIEMIGRVEFRESRRQMARCRIGVVPLSARCGCEKRQYASPLKLVEWMAAGVPVVATAVPSVVQFARDRRTALLVEPDTPAALAAALERLLGDDALRARLASAGLARAAENSHPRRAAGIVEFLEGLG